MQTHVRIVRRATERRRDFCAGQFIEEREPDDFAITLMQSRNAAPNRRILIFALDAFADVITCRQRQVIERFFVAPTDDRNRRYVAPRYDKAMR